jgi:integrase
MREKGQRKSCGTFSHSLLPCGAPKRSPEPASWGSPLPEAPFLASRLQPSSGSTSLFKGKRLVPFVKERLLSLQKEQKENRRLCGRCYNREFEDYICVNEIGDLIKPEYISSTFAAFLEENGMRRIRFHDLRHSCASLMLSSGVPMKQIQEWLGHSDFSTTANIYAHLEYSSKISSADAMLSGLGITAS